MMEERERQRRERNKSYEREGKMTSKAGREEVKVYIKIGDGKKDKELAWKEKRMGNKKRI